MGTDWILTSDKLLMTASAGGGADKVLFAKLGLRPMESEQRPRMEDQNTIMEIA